MSDSLFKLDNTRVDNVPISEDESNALFTKLREYFPWVKQVNYNGISNLYQHEILNETVMRTCVPTATVEAMINKKVASAHRLFALDSKTSMLYVTNLFQDENPSWVTDEMFIIGVTEHFEELNRPINPLMLSFKEYFFVASDNYISSYNPSFLENKDSDTVFSALVVDNEIKTIRKYTDFVKEGNDFLINWQSVYFLFAKKARRMDLIRDLFNKDFVTPV